MTEQYIDKPISVITDEASAIYLYTECKQEPAGTMTLNNADETVLGVVFWNNDIVKEFMDSGLMGQELMSQFSIKKQKKMLRQWKRQAAELLL